MEEERQHTGKENASGSELRPPPVTRPVLLPACPPGWVSAHCCSAAQPPFSTTIFM